MMGNGGDMNWKRKISTNAKKQIREKKKEQAEKFSQIYNRVRTHEFKDRDEINMDKFFILPKGLLEIGLSKPALAVYPVLCSLADFENDDWFPASLAKIAFFSGISGPTVSKALDELERHKLLSRNMFNEGSQHFYKYRIQFIRKSIVDDEKGNCVYFYTCIIESGIWANLKPRAKALYLSMRCSAKQDLDFYSLIEEELSGESYELNEYGQYLKNRKWDVVIEPLAELCRRAGIAETNYKSILDELEYHRLAERIGTGFKVWLKPKIRNKNACINNFKLPY
jgi:hypothetical protein